MCDWLQDLQDLFTDDLQTQFEKPPELESWTRTPKGAMLFGDLLLHKTNQKAADTFGCHGLGQLINLVRERSPEDLHPAGWD